MCVMSGASRLGLLCLCLVVIAAEPAVGRGADFQSEGPPATQGAGPDRSPVDLETVRFEWLRGRFPDASPDERARWSGLHQWAVECLRRRTAEVRDSLKAVGVDAVALPEADYGRSDCAVVIAADDAAGHYASWMAFSRALTEARPVFEGYRLATEAAEETTGAFRGDLTSALTMRTVGEQILRKGLGSNIEGAHPLTLSDDGRRLFDLLIWQEVKTRDQENTALLAGLIKARGWPGISTVGEKGSNAAWLLAQHADDDPLFQVNALRLMEPLVAPRDVDPSNYAYLYDRVMLKVSGRQRFGTQFTCRDGVRVPQPLEDADHIDALRTGAGLGSISDYADTMNQRFGAVCT